MKRIPSGALWAGLFNLIATLSWAGEMDCKDMLLNLADTAGYKLSCSEDHNPSGGDSNAKVHHEEMDAVANDGSHFIWALSATAGIRTYITVPDIRSMADNVLPGHGEIKSGHDIGDVRTLETTARLNGSDQKCIIFQHLGRKEYTGYKRVNYGAVCTARDLSVAYDALGKLHFPT